MGANDNALIKEVGQYISFDDTMDPFQCYNFDGCIFRKIDETGYSNFLLSLYEQKAGEQNKISKKAFEELLIKDYFDLISNPDHIHSLKNEIESIPLIMTHALLPIYNVQLSVDRIQIGEYEIIQFQKIGDYIKENGYVIPNTEENAFENDDYFLCIPFVDIVVAARDNDFAIESARKKLNIFISFLNYCIFSDYRGVDVVSNYSTAGSKNRYYLISDTSFRSSSSKDSIRKSRPELSELLELIVDNEKGNERLLDLVQKERNNYDEIENRLLNALNWLGFSIAEKNNALALTQATFAIECLLQSEPKGVPINKSIMASISEMIAFLLGTSFENRKELEKRFKNIYGIRSKVAHGKGDSVKGTEVLEAIGFAKQTIIAILTTPELKDAKTIQMINNFIEKKRYTCKEDLAN